MSSKHIRAGGKFTGNHTTLIPTAAFVCDVLVASPLVTKVSPGFITAGLPKLRGKRRVKIIDKGSQLLLKVRDNTSTQELHVYVSERKDLFSYIKREMKSCDIEVTLGN